MSPLVGRRRGRRGSKRSRSREGVPPAGSDEGQTDGTAERRKTERSGRGVEASESADSTEEDGEPFLRGPGGGKRQIGLRGLWRDR